MLVNVMSLDDYKNVLKTYCTKESWFGVVDVSNGIEKGIALTGTARVMYKDRSDDPGCVVIYPLFNDNGIIKIVLNIIKVYRDPDRVKVQHFYEIQDIIGEEG